MAQMMLGYVSFVSVDLVFLHSIQYNMYMYLLFTHSKYLCEMTLASASPKKNPALTKALRLANVLP